MVRQNEQHDDVNDVNDVNDDDGVSVICCCDDDVNDVVPRCLSAVVF